MKIINLEDLATLEADGRITDQIIVHESNGLLVGSLTLDGRPHGTAQGTDSTIALFPVG